MPGQVMSLIGRYGLGHACPVGGVILTAAHVAMDDDGGAERPKFFAYGMGNQKGYLSTAWAAQSRDIALLKVDAGDDPVMNRLSKSPPEVGSEARWQEYVMSGDVLSLRKRKGKIVADPIAGHFTFDPSPVPGASGSCVFNERNEVIGIVVWQLGENLSAKGVGVDITGFWWPGF